MLDVALLTVEVVALPDSVVVPDPCPPTSKVRDAEVVVRAASSVILPLEEVVPVVVAVAVSVPVPLSVPVVLVVLLAVPDSSSLLVDERVIVVE